VKTKSNNQQSTDVEERVKRKEIVIKNQSLYKDKYDGKSKRALINHQLYASIDEFPATSLPRTIIPAVGNGNYCLSSLRISPESVILDYDHRLNTVLLDMRCIRMSRMKRKTDSEQSTDEKKKRKMYLEEIKFIFNRMLRITIINIFICEHKFM
jgi:hypothetical protein